MKKLFLSSSFSDVAKIFEKCEEGKCKGKTVTFIPTASTVEKVTFYVDSAKKAFEKMGVVVDEVDISIKTPEEICDRINKNDYIYVSGGNTFFLLQEMKNKNIDKMIVEQINSGKLYIGESAGSMIASPNIEYVKMMDDYKKAVSLSDYKSLQLVDFYPVVHYTNFPFKEIVENIIKNYSTKINLKPITNKQAILVVGDKVQILES